MNQDPIAQMLTIIRNGQKASKYQVSIPYSKFKNNIADLLLKEGYIYAIETEGEAVHNKVLKITLSYFDNRPVITHIKRVSKPSCPIYKSYDELPKIFGGMGTLIVSTSKGLMSDHDIRRHAKSSSERLGGEIIAEVA